MENKNTNEMNSVVITLAHLMRMPADTKFAVVSDLGDHLDVISHGYTDLGLYFETEYGITYPNRNALIVVDKSVVDNYFPFN